MTELFRIRGYTVHWGPWQRPILFHETWWDGTIHYWLSYGFFVMTWVR